jgi:2-keto-4-pentenoate hydratase/2-oxohepta-3-ene-1,7-dioic acid hydratase in catechol pathway
MHLATVRIDGGAVRFGAVTEMGFIDLGAHFKDSCADITELLAKDLLAEAAVVCAASSTGIALDRLEYLPVIARPDTRVFAVGWAYRDHQTETNKEAPEFPALFTKFPSSLVGHGQPLVKPAISETFDYEGEVALIIGKGGRHIPAEKGLDHVAAFSILMDGSVRGWQAHSLTAGKNFDASSAFGPWMVTRDEIPDHKKMALTTRLNGKVMQQSSFANMVWDLGFLVSYISTFCELRPGDVISTGTPSGVGSRRTPPVFMRPGDTLEVEVSGIGVLRNTIVGEAR